MDKLIGGIFSLKGGKPRYDDDIIDRLSSRYSVSIFIAFCVIVTTIRYVGNPIQCWCPAHFTGSHTAYTNTICWVTNTYNVPFEEQIPLDDEPRQIISYYQWVPFILVCQALMCYLPAIVWKFMCRRSGLNVAGLIDAIRTGQQTSYSDMRDKATNYAVYQLNRYLIARTDKRKSCWSRFKMLMAKYCCLLYGKFYGNYLTISYIFVKFLYLFNAIGQFLLLNYFLQTDFHLYGLEVMLSFIKGGDWMQSSRFPVVTLCNFEVRHMTQVHKYIVQCTLPINLFNEKIFLFVWFWLACLSACTAYSFVKWIYKSLFWQSQVNYVQQQIKPLSDVKQHRSDIVGFTTNYLRRDGIFMVRLISTNLGSLASAEVLNSLWETYVSDRNQMLLGSEPDLPEEKESPATTPQDATMDLVHRAAQQMKFRARIDNV